MPSSRRSNRGWQLGGPRAASWPAPENPDPGDDTALSGGHTITDGLADEVLTGPLFTGTPCSRAALRRGIPVTRKVQAAHMQSILNPVGQHRRFI